MPGCPHQENCSLFEKFTVSSLLRVWRLLYCDKDEKFATCARYEFGLRGEIAPINLLPNGKVLKNIRAEEYDNVS